MLYVLFFRLFRAESRKRFWNQICKLLGNESMSFGIIVAARVDSYIFDGLFSELIPEPNKRNREFLENAFDGHIFLLRSSPLGLKWRVKWGAGGNPEFSSLLFHEAD